MLPWINATALDQRLRAVADFLARLVGGETLIVETKGRQDDETDAKHRAMREWADAVSEDGRFGKWRFAVADRPGAILDILAASP